MDTCRDCFPQGEVAEQREVLSIKGPPVLSMGRHVRSHPTPMLFAYCQGWQGFVYENPAKAIQGLCLRAQRERERDGETERRRDGETERRRDGETERRKRGHPRYRPPTESADKSFAQNAQTQTPGRAQNARANAGKPQGNFHARESALAMREAAKELIK